MMGVWCHHQSAGNSWNLWQRSSSRLFTYSSWLWLCCPPVTVLLFQQWDFFLHLKQLTTVLHNKLVFTFFLVFIWCFSSLFLQLQSILAPCSVSSDTAVLWYSGALRCFRFISAALHFHWKIPFFYLAYFYSSKNLRGADCMNSLCPLGGSST